MEQPVGSAAGAKASHDKPFACPARPGGTAGSHGTTPHGLHRGRTGAGYCGLSPAAPIMMQAPLPPRRSRHPSDRGCPTTTASPPGVSEAIAALVETGWLSGATSCTSALLRLAPRRAAVARTDDTRAGRRRLHLTLTDQLPLSAAARRAWASAFRRRSASLDSPLPSPAACGGRRRTDPRPVRRAFPRTPEATHPTMWTATSTCVLCCLACAKR